MAAKLDGLAPMGRRRSGSELETGGRLTMRSFQRLIGWAGSVGRDPLDNPDRGLRKRLAVLVSIGTMPMTIGWSLIYLAAGAPLAASIPAAYSIITPINTLVFNRTRDLRAYRFSQLLMTLLLPWGVMVSLGGFGPSSAVIIWAALCPLVALLIEDLRRTIAWVVGFLLLLISGAALEPYLAPSRLSPAFVTWFFALNLGMVIAIVFALLYYFVAQRNFFYERSETLLLSILPREISEALKAGERTIATHHELASILFADIAGFTTLSAAMAPMRLVDLLNEVFQCFDDLVEGYGLEKIKTIGDCYMVAAGVPKPRADHAKALIRLALDMQSAVSARRFGEQRLSIRIGVNSGPVVAGVIGHNKFNYDLWGDAVNMASRMELHGETGKISGDAQHLRAHL